jgi:hypothetical protein
VASGEAALMAALSGKWRGGARLRKKYAFARGEAALMAALMVALKDVIGLKKNFLHLSELHFPLKDSNKYFICMQIP